MKLSLRNLLWLFILAGVGMGQPLAMAQDGKAEEKKPSEIKMPLQPLSEDSLITMDFQDVDLTTVVKFMGELTGKNFLVSDQVRGKVTVVSPKKITVREAYKVFESILEMNGYAAVPGVDSIKIVPSGIARQSGVETYEGKDAWSVKPEDRIITQVIPLQFASGEEVRNIFAPLISREGMIVSYKPTNHLIVTDRAANIHRLLKIIEQLDIRIVEERIAVLPLEYASARNLATELSQLIAPGGQAGPPRPGGPSVLQRIIKIIPDERTNSLIVLANDQDLQDIRQLVSRLDQVAPTGKSQLHVRFLEYAQAEEMAKVLNAIVLAKTYALNALKGQPTTMPPMPPGGTTTQGTTITADKPTNSLVITASPQDFIELESVIKKLDTVRSQVLVEAVIVEASLEKALQIGVEWRIMDQPVEGATRGVGGTDFGLIQGVQQGTITDPGLLLGVARGFITINGQTFPNLGAVVRAFQKDTEVNVLSTPHLLTLDNEKAKIIVADNVPIIKTDLTTPLATVSTTTANIAVSRTFEYKDIGIQLEIVPHISKGSMVRLEIKTEVSNILSIDPTNPGFVTTRKREATTTVSIENGQVVVIGGLIRDDKSLETKKVPCVGNVPVLGWLFKTFSGTKSKTNLMVFISPHILRNSLDLEQATLQKKQEADENLQKLKEERKNEVRENLEMLIK